MYGVPSATKPHVKAGQLAHNQIDTSKSSLLVRERTKEAQFLSLVLATMTDPKDHTGRASPTLPRLATMVPFPDRLEEVIEELEAGGNWMVQRDGTTDKPIGFFPSFINADLTARAKTFKAGMNQLKYLRYARYQSAGARLIAAWILMNFPQYYTDLGFKADSLAGREPTHQIWFRQNGKLQGRKLCHGTHFDHQLLRKRTPKAYEILANLTDLPDHMLTSPRSVTLNISDFRAVGFETMEEFAEALGDLWISGDWTYKIRRGPLPSNPFLQFERDITFTPTPQWHRKIWRMDFLGGGPAYNEWERAHGFYPVDRQRDSDNLLEYAPLLGMNTHYLLLHPDTLEPFWSGETRTSAIDRLKSHLLSPTSAKMEQALYEYIRYAPRPPIILPTAQIHHDYIAEFEMAVIPAFEAKGYTFMNTIRDPAWNRKTITLDPDLSAMSHRQRQQFLNTMWATHGVIKEQDLSDYPEVARIMRTVFDEFSGRRRNQGDMTMAA